MIRLARSRLALSVAATAALATIGTLAISTAASAHDEPHPTPTPSPPGTPTEPGGAPVFLAAALNGRNEVPTQGGPAVGDSDGQAVQLLRIKGNQVSFALTWKGIAAPTAGHIHLGATGTNGAVKIPFFGTALPGTLNAAVGSVTVTDQALLDSLKSAPTGFYANLHTAEFPGGAVRGQLHKVTNPLDLTSVLRGGPLASLLDGDQELPADNGKATGDPDGQATAFVQAGRDRVKFAVRWSGIGAPNNLHLHEGTIGANGPVAVPFFPAETALPASFSGVAGTATGVDANLIKRINQTPANFYANVHTAEFPGGAVRGQLFFGGGGTQTGTFNASVVRGKQIYSCTQQADGTYAFTQHNVSARLQGNIRHSFVKDDAGPPQWVAPDGSAVTGKLIAKTPNGPGNIAELDLEATANGKPGVYANTVEILRLNTVGGVAPAGACDPKTQPIAKVPYQADYLFISK